MDTRDQIDKAARAALTGILSNPDFELLPRNSGRPRCKGLAREAYDIAEAMVEESRRRYPVPKAPTQPDAPRPRLPTFDIGGA